MDVKDNVSVSRELLEQRIASCEQRLRLSSTILCTACGGSGDTYCHHRDDCIVLWLKELLAQPSEQPAKAEQPGDVGDARTAYFELAGLLARHIPSEAFDKASRHLETLKSAALSPSVPAEAVAFVRMRGDSIDWESREPQFFKDAIASDAGDYPTHMGYWTAPLFLAPPANDEAPRLLREYREHSRDWWEDNPLLLRDWVRRVDAFLATQQEEKG